jgi:hypothetical protein
VKPERFCGPRRGETDTSPRASKRALHAVAAGAVACALAVAPSVARADANDLALNRLTFFDGAAMGSAAPDWQFRGGCGSMIAAYAQCLPDNTLFANLTNELAGALAPGLLTPASTIGYNRVYIGYEHSITNINTAVNGTQHWQRGTEGAAPAGVRDDGTARTRSRVPDVLFASRIHMRHGLPYGFEAGVQGTYLHDSGLVAMGLDIKWSLWEGFRRGVGYIPDFAVRGSVNTLVGNQQLYLTVVSLDGVLSKHIPIGGSMQITPYLGGQALIVFGDSTVIDGTPRRSGYQECSRRRTVYTTDPMTGAVSSSLVCDTGVAPPAMSAANDSVNDVVFTPTRLLRARALGGLRFKYGVFSFTAEFVMDVMAPSWMTGSCGGTGSQPSYCVTGRPTASDTYERDQVRIDPNFRQYSINLGAGVIF